jgi:hypothetical protein
LITYQNPLPLLKLKETSGLEPNHKCYLNRKGQQANLKAIQKFHSETKLPTFQKPQDQKRFLSKCGVKDSQLYKKNGTKLRLVVIDPDHKNSILLHAHENLGHRGIYAVQTVVEAQFFWPNMRKDIHHHVRSCHECQIRNLKRLEIPLTISAPVSLFAKIDIMYMPLAKDIVYSSSKR